MVLVGGGRRKQEVVADGGCGQRMLSTVPGLTHTPFLIGCPSIFQLLPFCLHASFLGFPRNWIRRLVVKDHFKS